MFCSLASVNVSVTLPVGGRAGHQAHGWLGSQHCTGGPVRLRPITTTRCSYFHDRKLLNLCNQFSGRWIINFLSSTAAKIHTHTHISLTVVGFSEKRLVQNSSQNHSHNQSPHHLNFTHPHTMKTHFLKSPTHRSSSASFSIYCAMHVLLTHFIDCHHWLRVITSWQ